jgi:ABC-2 type transport system permease protein
MSMVERSSTEVSTTELSTTELSTTGRPAAEALAGAEVVPSGVPTRPASTGARPVLGWLRFFRSELRLVFRRRRNLLLLAVAGAFPLLIGIALKLAAPGGVDSGPVGGGGGLAGVGGANPGTSFFNQLAGNGVFLALISLTVLLILVLPVVVAVVAGDSVAGEAGHGTLRYLLTVPAGRSRLLAVKLLAIAVYSFCATFVVSVTALLVGVVLFPVGPVTMLSGATVPLADGLIRILFVTLYLGAAMTEVGAIGLAISTLTEHAIGAIAALLVLVVTSEVVDQVPQMASIAPYLPTHWWLSFDSLLRVPVDTYSLTHGLLSFAVYTVIACAFAWARFTSADVTS